MQSCTVALAPRVQSSTAMRNIKHRLGSLSLAAGALLGSTLPALADDETDGTDDAPASTAPAGHDAVARGVQAPARMLAIRIGLGLALDKDNAGEPISIMPDIAYGVTDDLQLGIVHTGPMGDQTRPGAGLCLTGEDGGCPNVYDNIGFDAMYRLVAKPNVHLSAHGSIYATSIDAGTSMLTIGAAAKYHANDRIAVFADPQLGFQLTDRDILDDALFLPVEVQFQVAPPTSARLLTGIAGSLSNFGDTYIAPLGVGVTQNLTPVVDVGARFSFDNLLGKQADGVGRADARSAMAMVNLRL